MDHTTCLASGQTDPSIDRSLSDVPAWPGPLAPPSRTSRASRRAADERGAGCRSLASRTPSHEEWSVRMSFSSGTGIGMVHRIASIATAICRNWCRVPTASPPRCRSPSAKPAEMRAFYSGTDNQEPEDKHDAIQGDVGALQGRLVGLSVGSCGSAGSGTGAGRCGAFRSVGIRYGNLRKSL